MQDIVLRFFIWLDLISLVIFTGFWQELLPAELQQLRVSGDPVFHRRLRHWRQRHRQVRPGPKHHHQNENTMWHRSEKQDLRNWINLRYSWWNYHILVCMSVFNRDKNRVEKYLKISEPMFLLLHFDACWTIWEPCIFFAAVCFIWKERVHKYPLYI